MLGAPLHTLSKLYDVPVNFVALPSFGAVYCFICGRRRVAVAQYRMIYLVPVNSPLFPLTCVPAKGLTYCIIARLSDVCWAAVLCCGIAIFQGFLKRNAHLQTFLLVYTCQSGALPCASGVNLQVESCTAGISSICRLL